MVKAHREGGDDADGSWQGVDEGGGDLVGRGDEQAVKACGRRDQLFGNIGRVIRIEFGFKMGAKAGLHGGGQASCHQKAGLWGGTAFRHAEFSGQIQKADI